MYSKAMYNKNKLKNCSDLEVKKYLPQALKKEKPT